MNSKQFVIDRINQGLLNIDGLNAKDIENATFLQPFSVWKFDEMDKILKDNIMEFGLSGRDLNDNEGNLVVTIEYDPCGDFTYVTTDKRTHDGTLIFLAEALNEIRVKLMGAQTYDKRSLSADLQNIFDYNIKYTIGDFVVINKFGNQYAPKDKPWMKQLQIVCLPIKCEFIPKSE